MDSKDSAAAAASADATKPATPADLGACFQAMRLGDPSSPRKPQQYPAPASRRPPQPQPQPLQVSAPTTKGDVLRLLHGVQEPRPNPQPQGYGEGECSSSAGGAGGGCVPPYYGSYSPSGFYASHFGAYSPRFDFSDAPISSLVAELGEMTAAGARRSGSVAPSFSHPSVPQSSSTASSSGSHFQPPPSAPHQVGAASSASGQDAAPITFQPPPSAHHQLGAASGQNAALNPFQPPSSAHHQLGAGAFASGQNAALIPFQPPLASAHHQPQNAGLNMFQPPSDAYYQLGADSSASSQNAALNPFQPPSSANHQLGAAACTPGQNAGGLDPFQPLPNAHHQLAAAASSSASGQNGGGLNPYASAFQGTLSQSANQLYYQSLIPMPPARRLPTLEQVRSSLLDRPMDPALLAFPETASHVVYLLGAGGERVRESVLAGLKRDAERVLGSSEGHAVFLALVRACVGRGRVDDIHRIVQALCNSDGFHLVFVAKHNDGLTALKELISAVAPLPFPQTRRPLVCWLLREGMMGQYKGVELLQHCLTTMSYDDCKIIIRLAIIHIRDLLSSAVGSRCLAECFVYARGQELRDLDAFILNHTSDIARGQYSNYFLQRAIDYGSALLQERIAQRVAADVENLSADQFGSYVVEACFIRMHSPPAPLQHVLSAFLDLPGDRLAEMVRGGYSNYVVHKLLTVANQYFPSATRELARRIQGIPEEVKREMHAHGVMQVVRKLFQHKHPRYYDDGAAGRS